MSRPSFHSHDSVSDSRVGCGVMSRESAEALTNMDAARLDADCEPGLMRAAGSSGGNDECTAASKSESNSDTGCAAGEYNVTSLDTANGVERDEEEEEAGANAMGATALRETRGTTQGEASDCKTRRKKRVLRPNPCNAGSAVATSLTGALLAFAVARTIPSDGRLLGAPSTLGVGHGSHDNLEVKLEPFPTNLPNIVLVTWKQENRNKRVATLNQKSGPTIYSNQSRQQTKPVEQWMPSAPNTQSGSGR
jgi:hypothetical protein